MKLRAVALSLLCLSCDGPSHEGVAPARSATTTGSTLAETTAPPPVLGTLFEVSAFTENNAGCDAEGSSIMSELQGDRFLYLYEGTFFGTNATAVATCKSADDCREKSKAWREQQRTPPNNAGKFLNFIKTIDERHREGFYVFTGWSGGPGSGPCTKAQYGTTKLELQGDILTMELRAAVGDVPRTEDGCSTGVPEKALAGKPCSLRQVLRAKASGPL